MKAWYGRNSCWIASSWYSPMNSSKRITRMALSNAWIGSAPPASALEPKRFRVHEYRR
jgi:hypothetical protein